MLFNIRQRDTSPIHTKLIEARVAGANLIQNSDFPTKIHEDLIVNSALLPLSRYVMTKSNKGIISLHYMVPYQRVSVRFGANNQVRLQPTIVFVMLNCNKNEFDTKDAGVHVISDSTLAMAELSFNSERTYNGVSVNGSPTEHYIPRNMESWTTPYKGSEVGQYLNQSVLNTFFELKRLASELDNTDDPSVDPEAIHEHMASLWNTYITDEQGLIDKGYLVQSNVIYADSSALRPITACFQNTTSRLNKYLNAPDVYGTLESGASFAPDTSMIYSVGTITQTHEEPVSGYQYGIYSINSKKDDIQVVPDDQKETTMETCTREVMVYDASGRTCALQMTVNDIMRSDKPVKRAQNLASLPAGTNIIVTGKLAIRVKQQGSLAVSFRISDPAWTTTGRSRANEVAGVMDLDLDTSQFDVNELTSLVGQTDVPVKAPVDNDSVDAEAEASFITAPTAERPSTDPASTDAFKDF